MLQEERKQYILNLLSAKSSVTVAELSKAFQLSEVSVRKMLVKMEEQGEIKGHGEEPAMWKVPCRNIHILRKFPNI